jgi:putative CocE/NonD family hydrolase
MRCSAALCGVLASVVALHSARAQAPIRYDAVLADSNLMIPVRDGAHMSTRLYRPATNGVPVQGRFPILLQRTPYDLNTSSRDAEFFARHGYVVALQNIRGRYRSEGKFLKVQPADATDGYDVIGWLAKQPY